MGHYRSSYYYQLSEINKQRTLLLFLCTYKKLNNVILSLINLKTQFNVRLKKDTIKTGNFRKAYITTICGLDQHLKMIISLEDELRKCKSDYLSTKIRTIKLYNNTIRVLKKVNEKIKEIRKIYVF